MKSLCPAMALVGLTSHYAAAADGTLNFIGKIVNSSCTLVSDNENGVIVVKMGSVPLSKLKMIPMAPGQKLRSILASKDCDAGTYFIVLDGAPALDAPSTNILALDAGNPTAEKSALS